MFLVRHESLAEKCFRIQSGEFCRGVHMYSPPRELNWVLTLVMSIFFGALGVDRFMMGQVGLGLLKLVTAGGFGIWWLIDIILIAGRYPFAGVVWTD